MLIMVVIIAMVVMMMMLVQALLEERKRYCYLFSKLSGVAQNDGASHHKVNSISLTSSLDAVTIDIIFITINIAIYH